MPTATHSFADITTTLKPFQDHGFPVYDLKDDWRCLYERMVPAITQTSYEEVAGRSTVDLPVSRQPLAVWAG